MFGDALVAIIHIDWSYAMATIGFCNFPIRSHFLMMYSPLSSAVRISGEFVFWVGCGVATGLGCNGGVGIVAVCLWTGGRSPIGDIGRGVKDIAGAGRGVKVSVLLSCTFGFSGAGVG